ncbi:MAG TPA: class I SAM-dependent methyltransferase [Balneolaceae bacterium]
MNQKNTGSCFTKVQARFLMTDFKDNFSKQSNTYLKYRPTYPGELFEYLRSLTEGHDVAWDCGTGNGQAAISLTKYYKKVYATDPSEQQIRNALPHRQIVYKVEKAEHSGLKDQSVDLITVAQAIHWFNFDEFYTEAKRVLKDNGAIAAWTYSLPAISDKIDNIIKDFHDQTLGEYWLYENSLVIKRYSTIPFPFKKLSTPAFLMHKELSLNDLVGFISSWSAVQRYKSKNGNNPVDKLETKLAKLWGGRNEVKEARWEIILKAGQNIGR